jgi:hypothetical protein
MVALPGEAFVFSARLRWRKSPIDRSCWSSRREETDGVLAGLRMHRLQLAGRRFVERIFWVGIELTEMKRSLRRAVLFSGVLTAPNPPCSTLPFLGARCPFGPCPPAVAMENQFFIRQQNLKLSRSLVAASEVAAVKADARQEKLLKLVSEEVANEPPPRKN